MKKIKPKYISVRHNGRIQFELCSGRYATPNLKVIKRMLVLNKWTLIQYNYLASAISFKYGYPIRNKI